MSYDKYVRELLQKRNDVSYALIEAEGIEADRLSEVLTEIESELEDSGVDLETLELDELNGEFYGGVSFDDENGDTYE